MECVDEFCFFIEWLIPGYIGGAVPDIEPACSETKIFIHYKFPASESELPPENHMAFTVADVDETCQTLVRQGLTMEIPPKDYDWGRSAYLRDPDGHQVEITKKEQ